MKALWPAFFLVAFSFEPRSKNLRGPLATLWSLDTLVGFLLGAAVVLGISAVIVGGRSEE